MLIGIKEALGCYILWLVPYGQHGIPEASVTKEVTIGKESK